MLFRQSNAGFSLVEILVGLAIIVGVLTLLAYLSSMGNLTRGGIEKKTESFQMASNIISKLYNATFNDIEMICRNKGALGVTVADPCVTSSNQMADLNPLGPFSHPLEQFLDATIDVTTMQNSSATPGAPISCLHIDTCTYLLDSILIEVKISYHWHEPTISGAQTRSLSFRRGAR